MLLSVPVLGERVRPLAWLWAGLGFAGVLLIRRPGSGLDPLGVVFALTNAALATAYHLLTRKLAGTESMLRCCFRPPWWGRFSFA